MIREQITINALRGSRLCVMVLAATQALTTVDMALIRMISNVRSRDVIIFVNRIDELADPAREIPEIRESIRETLRTHDGPAEAEILFGCGHWAAEALAGQVEGLTGDSAGALLGWAEAQLDGQSPQGSVEDMVFDLSGLPALAKAMADRIEAGAGAQMLREIEVDIDNLEQSASASEQVVEARLSGGGCRMAQDALADALTGIEHRAQSRLQDGLVPIHHALTARVDAARQTFVARATAALVEHLERHGALDVWSYDPCGLRVLLRSGFQRYLRGVSKHGQDCMQSASKEISALYAQAFDLNGQAPDLQPPPLPAAEPPIVLGQTIALDLRGSWWSRLWRKRRGYQACAEDFAQLIREETQPILTKLLDEHARQHEADLSVILREFLGSHRKIMLDMAGVTSPAQASMPPTAHPGLEIS